MVRSANGSTGFGDKFVIAGSVTVTSAAVVTATPEATFNVSFPVFVAAGIFTTICVADWLTNVVTGALTLLNSNSFTKSRFVPAMVRSVACLMGLGPILVTAGSVT